MFEKEENLLQNCILHFVFWFSQLSEIALEKFLLNLRKAVRFGTWVKVFKNLIKSF